MNCRADPVLQTKQRSRRQLATVRRFIALGATGVLGALSACVSLGTSSRSHEARVIYRVASATDIDTVRGFATLPVHQGLVGKQVVWYIVTESSDRADAVRRGVTWSPRLKEVAGTAASQRAHESRGMLTFDAGVDFSPQRLLMANADSGFPPASASPGSLADPFYSPFVVLNNGIVLNAPIVADERAALDRVERLDPTSGTVRIRISRGYVNDQTIWYTSTDASDPGVAAMERATFAPAIRAVPGEGMATGAGSARTGILAVINGETGADNPERQGLRSALLDDRAPLNVLEHAPDPTGKNPIYSPAWDLTLVRWSVAAVEKNQRTKIFAWSHASALLASGFLVAEAPVRVLINCPVIVVFNRRAQ